MHDWSVAGQVSFLNILVGSLQVDGGEDADAAWRCLGADTLGPAAFEVTLRTISQALTPKVSPGRRPFPKAFYLINTLTQATSVNPLFGPRPETLLMLGAKSTWRIVERMEVWRLLAAVFLHGGLLHLLGNVAAILAYGR